MGFSIKGNTFNITVTIFFAKIFNLSKKNRILFETYDFIFNNSAHNFAGPKVWIE